jgi:flagellar hook-associated protein 2
MAGPISSGIGLVSGLPTQSIIDQLISLDSRPLIRLQSRIRNITAQRTAFTDLSARLLGLKSTIARFDELQFFRSSRASSSNDSVLTATAGENAARGTFQFQVRSLVSNNQLIGNGFANSDSQPVGIGSLSFEIGNGRLNPPTSLERLNGGEGVRRGSIEITDSSGDSATIELDSVLNVRDVLEAINSRADIRVSARVSGDRIVIEDQADGTGTLSIGEVAGGSTARDLGIVGQADAAGLLTGSSIIRLDANTRLSTLNDGNGVGVGKTNEDIDITVGDRTFTVGLRGLLTRDTYLDVLNDGNGVRQGTFTITNRAGESADIVIDASVRTIGDVMDRIDASGIGVTAAVGAARGQLQLTDGSTPATGLEEPTFKITDTTGSAAADLGLVFDITGETATGNEIYRIDTVGDVMRAIEFANDQNGVLNDVIEASVSDGGRGLEITSTGGEFTVDVAEGAIDSFAAEQLGMIGSSESGSLVTRDVLAGLNSVLLNSLNGGNGIALGRINVRAADGSTGDFDLSSAATTQDMINLINAQTATTKVSARINDAGNGITFVDESGVEGTMAIQDFSPGARVIHDLFGLNTDAAGIVSSNTGTLDSGNAQLQYVSQATSLDNLNAGRGISEGSFRITASDGQTYVVALNENQENVGDLLERINSIAGASVEARINRNGDGIEIIDTAGGTGTLKIEDIEGGRTAGDLNLTGEGVAITDADGEARQQIDGSYEFRVEIDADDTLADVRTKINDLGIDVGATIINDGSATNPFHLVVNSEVTGTRGQLTLDSGTTNLSFDTLVRAQDAVVFFGGAGAENPIVLTSSTNSLSGVLENVTIDLTGTSDEPVEISVSQDVDRITSDLGSFVSTYNAILDQIDDVTSFDSETNQRGVLFGDSTVNVIESRLRSVVSRKIPGAVRGFDRLTLVGVSTGSGGRLSFDEGRFREIFAENPQAIESLFVGEESGLGKALDETLEELTRSFDGTLARKDRLLENREELLNDRIESLQDLLARKRDRLSRQFQGLETSLADLQGAQNSLGVIAGLAGA